MGRTRRKKKVTQKAVPPDGEGKKVPKAFVVERGKVGHVLSQLVLDIRKIMEPNTASKLKVRHKNVLKDFVSVAGPLGVTHLILLSRTPNFINLKICVLPRGPTVTFHVKSFCLAREVLSSLKTPTINPSQFLYAPMLALNNFDKEEKSSHLLTTIFQNMFPTINVHTVKLATIKRCLLLNFNPETKLIDLRHYSIRVLPRGTSRGVKKLSRTHLPNLGKLNDISEYLLDGYGSESDGEDVLAGGSEVTLAQNLGRANLKSEQSTIKLSELGPRMSLELVKIEAGLCDGEVLYHAFVQKTRKEARELRRVKEKQRWLKEKRRREQEANVARKQRAKEEHKARCLAGMGVEQGEQSGSGSDEEEEDREWFRREVGQDPDPETFGSSSKVKTGRQKKRSLSGPTPKPKRSKVAEGLGVKSKPLAKKTKTFQPGKRAGSKFKPTGSKFKPAGGRTISKKTFLARKMRTRN